MLKDLPSLILASKSPRRQELLSQMGLSFRVEIREVDESFPPGLKPEEVALYIAEQKARAFDLQIRDEIVITADTIVCIDSEILGKPADSGEATRMLNTLSGMEHQVITGVTLLSGERIRSFYDTTFVQFAPLSDVLIREYVESGAPMDKAGAYGIQDRIGLLGIRGIRGSYTNVVGLPTQRLAEELASFRSP